MSNNQLNLFGSKGYQKGHISTADMGNYVLTQQRVLNGENVQVFKQRSLCLAENGILGTATVHGTALVRGFWFWDDATYLNTAGGQLNFTPDHDLRPVLWGLNGLLIDGTGSVSNLTWVIGNDWATSAVAGSLLPIGFQALTSASGNKLRMSAAFRNIKNMIGLPNSIGYKRLGDCDIQGIAFNVVGSDLTPNVDYMLACGYRRKVGNGLSLSPTELTQWWNFFNTPVTMLASVGSIKTNAFGDLDTDAFNEGFGWNEYNCNGSGQASLTIQIGTIGLIPGAAIRFWNWIAGTSPTVTINGSPAAKGVHYVVDPAGDGTCIFQVIADITADTPITVAP